MVEYYSGGILPDIKNIPLGNERMGIPGSVEIEQFFLCKRVLSITHGFVRTQAWQVRLAGPWSREVCREPNMDKQLERGSAPSKLVAASKDAQLARLRAIRKLVEENNQSCLSTEMIVCQIYMESRFDKAAQAEGSSARGLMQLLKAANRELFRLDNLHQPVQARQPEAALYRQADAFHDSPAFIDEATNIRTGTRYLQALIDKAKREGSADPIAEAYKDYRGVRNGVYYQKISAAAEKLKQEPDGVEVLRRMIG